MSSDETFMRMQAAHEAAAERAGQRAAMLHELAQIGMEMARALRGQMQALEAQASSCSPSSSSSSGGPGAGSDAALASAKGEVALAFSRVARGVRQTLALEARLERGEFDRQARAPADLNEAERAAYFRWRPGPPVQAPAPARSKAAVRVVGGLDKAGREAGLATRKAFGRASEAETPRGEMKRDADSGLRADASFSELFEAACREANVDPAEMMRQAGLDGPEPAPHAQGPPGAG